MIINPSQLTRVVPRIHLGDDEIACFLKLRNLSLIMNQELTWNDHWPNHEAMSKCLHAEEIVDYCIVYPNRDEKEISFITHHTTVPILRCIFFGNTAGLREKMCCWTSFTAKEFATPCMYKLIKSGTPRYLRGGLQFGRSRRMLNLITPINRSNSLACSFLVQGAILCRSAGGNNMLG
jgi:hypothetical protein